MVTLRDMHSKSYSSGAVVSSSSSSRKKAEKPPFKLCFSRQREVGRSDARSTKTNANFIATKFYSREMEESTRCTDVSDTVIKEMEKETRKPKDIYRWPVLTSHTYGWWHDKGISPKDPRFNFHKRTSDLVSHQMRIYAQDRRPKELHH